MEDLTQTLLFFRYLSQTANSQNSPLGYHYLYHKEMVEMLLEASIT